MTGEDGQRSFRLAMSEDTKREPKPLPLGLGYAGWTYLAVGLFTLARLAYLPVSGLDLYGDEAQYWTWSLDPAFGYFSKPPLLAWIIAATTAVCGDGAACIRVSAPVLHGLTALVLAGLARFLYGGAAGLWTAVAYVTLPAVFLGSLVISTDTPLLLCWSVALYAVARGVESPVWRWWILAGVALGFGLLAKYAAAYFLVGLALYLLVSPQARHQAGFLKPVVTALIAGVVLLPNIWWNAETGFITFQHTADNANIGGASGAASLFQPLKLLSFWGEQIGVFGPVLFFALIYLLAADGRRRLAEDRSRFLISMMLPPLIIVSVVALLSRAHANWAATAYPAATVLVVGWLVLEARARWVAIAAGLNTVLAVGLFLAVSQAGQATYWLPKWLAFDKGMRGWSELGGYASAVRSGYPEARFLVEDRMLFAELMHQLKPRPEDMVIWSPNDRIDNHYELVAPLPADEVPGFFILVTENPSPDAVTDRFDRYGPVAKLVMPIGTDRSRTHYFFLLENFKNYQ